jgi:hypothetical protein
MNKALFIMLLFLYACHSNDDKTIAFLNEGIERCDSIINNENEKCYLDFECSVKERPQIVKPYKDNSDHIKIISEKILKTIEQRKTDLINKNENSNIYLPELLNEYNNLIDSLFTNDSVIREKIKTCFKFERKQLRELSFYELNLLINKINNFNNSILHHYLKKIESTGLKFATKEVVVVPQSKYLCLNEIYKAVLYLVATDTTPNCTFNINGKSILSEHGKVFYVDSASHPKKVNKLCYLEIELPITRQILTYKFLLKYQFKNQ